jgi:hypothetical protein
MPNDEESQFVQTSDSPKPKPPDHSTKSNIVDEEIISLISECFHLIYPPSNEINNIFPNEQLKLIKVSLETFIFSPDIAQSSIRSDLINILKNFYVLVLDQKADDSKLFQLVYQFSKQTFDDIYEISKLNVEDHQKISISDELLLLLNSTKIEIPHQIKNLKDKFKIQAPNSSLPIFQDYVHYFHNFCVVLRSSIKLLKMRKSDFKNQQLSIESIPKFMQETSEEFQNSTIQATRKLFDR